MRVNGPGCPASLLTSARSGVAFESPALLARKVDREVRCPAGNGRPGSPAHVRSVYLPPWRGKQIGDCDCPESSRASALRVRLSPSPLIGSASRLATAPGLNPGELRPWGFNSLRFRWPLPNRRRGRSDKAVAAGFDSQVANYGEIAQSAERPTHSVGTAR